MENLSLILIAAFFANAPFVNQGLFFIFDANRFFKQGKPLFFRLLEWLCGYFLVGLLAYFFETHLGSYSAQGWQFYVITLCLFAVLAYPGFVYCYLMYRK